MSAAGSESLGRQHVVQGVDRFVLGDNCFSFPARYGKLVEVDGGRAAAAKGSVWLSDTGVGSKQKSQGSSGAQKGN